MIDIAFDLLLILILLVDDEFLDGAIRDRIKNWIKK